MAQSVKDLDTAELSLQSVTNTLPHHRIMCRDCKTSNIALSIWLHSTPIIEPSVLSKVLI